MSKRKTIPVFDVPLEAYERFAALIKREGKTLAKGLRDAMREYAAMRGVDIETDVGEWGGIRPRTPDDKSE